MRAAGLTDPGLVRGSNQDCVLVGESLLAVADGMGGHAGGEVAASTAIETLARALDGKEELTDLVEATLAANREVYDRAERAPELRGMGTTLTAATVRERAGRRLVALINVGDSRAYLLEAGRLRQLTTDHSVVEEMVQSGEISEAQAAVHPHRHIVTRAIGIDATVDVDAWELTTEPGARLLLCSDGLTNECSDHEIEAILRRLADPNAAARELVTRALAHGGVDNVSVVVADLDAAPGAGDTASSTSTAADEDTGPATTDSAIAPSPEQSPFEQITLAVPTTPAAPGPAEATRTGAARAARRRLRPQRQYRKERLFTAHVVVFVVALVAILGGTAGLITWFNNATYYVGVDHGSVAIYEGRPGGMLWFHPQLLEQTSLSTSSVLASNVSLLRSGLLESSFASARDVVQRLRAEQSLLSLPGSSTTIASTLAPAPTVAPTTTVVTTTPPRAPSTTTPKAHVAKTTGTA